MTAVGVEVAQLKRRIAKDDEAMRLEAQQLRAEITKEKFARRNDLNAMRYEFEEFIHKKIDKVLEQVEDMRRTERRDDKSQQVEIDDMTEDIERLKRMLVGVQSAWAGLVSQFQSKLDPASANLEMSAVSGGAR